MHQGKLKIVTQGPVNPMVKRARALDPALSVVSLVKTINVKVKIIRHNMLLWFVIIYGRNLKKLQFTTQRFDTLV